MMRALAAVLLLGSSFSSVALDGKWTPAQVLEIDPSWLKQQGLNLKPADLWNGKRGTGLLSGTVSIAGCSGAFVSDSGLIVTNHHCLFSVVQEHSTPTRDLIRDGFLANSRDQELPSPTLRVEVPKRFTDVTTEVLGAVPASANPAQRLDAIKAKIKQITSSCQSAGTAQGMRCKISIDDEGVRYTLIETLELRDVRLVYAPPRAVGEFGGEIDNWSWPRHTGDFAIARAYAAADGKPADYNKDNARFRPEFFFQIASQALAAGDFVMVLGYPGVTYRALIAEEMQERRERFFPTRETIFGELIAILENAAKQDPAVAIALAGNIKGIQNRYKNAQGQIAGLDRGVVVAKQREIDLQVLAFAKKTPTHRAAAASHAELLKVLDARQSTWERDFLLNLIAMGNEQRAGSIPPLPKALYFAATLAHLARERTLPDAARAEGFTEADVPKLQQRFARERQNYDVRADQSVFFALVKRALALPASQRIPAVDTVFGGMSDTAIVEKIATFYQSPLLRADSDAVLANVDMKTLQQTTDALQGFGAQWNDALRALRAQDQRFESQTALHRPIWRRAMQAYLGKPIAPDANSSLRVSFAHVQGYSPRDGLRYEPFTSLAGVLEKNSGQAPFDVPQSVLQAIRSPSKSARCQLPPAQIAVNFLADGDTSGGNSGSPVVNGDGELVGINFDRVWENVAGDFGFNPAVSRNISVDIRYLLWNLSCVISAGALLQELNIKR